MSTCIFVFRYDLNNYVKCGIIIEQQLEMRDLGGSFMIISAKVARQQSNQKKTLKWVKCSNRQLRKVERAINRASKKGRKSIPYFKPLYKEVITTLKANGYKLYNRSNYKWGAWVEIAWTNK